MNIDRIKKACQLVNGCWLKIGVRPSRYGSFRISGRLTRAHRASWEAHFGPIPDGLYVCHRCNNKPCCNPKHLYLATHQQNLIDAGRDGLLPGALRPRGATLINSMRTECKSGHPFTPENTYTYPSGKRACKACRLDRQHKYMDRNRPQLNAKALARYHKTAELAKDQP